MDSPRSNIVVEKCSNTYSVKVIPKDSDEPINKNCYFGIYSLDDHFIVMGPYAYVNTETLCCKAIAHTEKEAYARAKEKIREHVSDLWEDYRRRGIDRVLDNSGEGILDGWRPPIVMPDD